MAVGLLLCGGLASAACDGLPGEGGQEPRPSGGESGPGGGPDSGRALSPLANPRGTGPGLAPVTGHDGTAAALRTIEKLATKGRGPRTGYERDEFGYAWLDTADGVPLARNGCDTRNDLLRRDGERIRLRSGSDCVVVAMTLHDPYTGKTLTWRKQRAAAVQIDHVVPLSYGWQLGASRWSADKRRQFANDPLNLLPVDGPTNSAKGDSGPASWLPPAKGIRCAYVLRFAQVAEKYALSVTSADKRAMTAQCSG
ncbi:HNH endonuclease [Streptomyces sp. NA04227]|uniref:HNH endonuclease family protein n=1 Tax=Streptomyces sp. NA04227 TaxID=2742136 RepID=UPI0015908CE0|nr:HNH endonuclease family protein [Streptomyces sp. NA04227]QKW07034.1 HNH endonuclease [Streptomyces sp. NA04227]